MNFMAAHSQALNKSMGNQAVAVRTVVRQKIGTVRHEDLEWTAKAHASPLATFGCRARSRLEISSQRNDTSARRGSNAGRGRSRKREKLTRTKAKRAQVD